MITVYYGKADCCAAEVLTVNPFAPLVQTAARLRGCDRSPRPRKESVPQMVLTTSPSDRVMLAAFALTTERSK
jgi:hypothetical protein